jgi:hypothetical protein
MDAIFDDVPVRSVAFTVGAVSVLVRVVFVALMVGTVRVEFTVRFEVTVAFVDVKFVTVTEGNEAESAYKFAPVDILNKWVPVLLILFAPINDRDNTDGAFTVPKLAVLPVKSVVRI